MSTFENSAIHEAIKQKKYKCITEFANVIHSHKPHLIVTEYAGSEPRLFVDDEKSILMLPAKMDTIQESAVANAIEKGTIFDDAENVANNAEYIEKTCLPCRAMANKGVRPSKPLRFVLTGIIGVMDDEGHCDVSNDNIRNGYNYIRDITSSDISNGKLIDMTSKYINGNSDEEDIDISLRREIANIADDISNIDGISEDDEITDGDFDYVKVDDTTDVESDYQEGFLTKRPKKLKPLPRDIISYITIELNAIQDSNDQAMLSGYTCSKLELVDFYLNCIDTQDERYIVPHTRQYLVNMQKQLNDLLTRILRIKPINKNDRVWQVNVNYPEGWRG